MSILHDALAAFHAAVASAGAFANPQARVAELEADFKREVADAHAALEARITALELDLAILRDATPAIEPPHEPLPPAA